MGVAPSRRGRAGSETAAMSIASRNEWRRAMTATPIKRRRELAHRASNGIEVFLGRPLERCLDRSRGPARRQHVRALLDAESALDAFYHPYGYRAALAADLAAGAWRTSTPATPDPLHRQ